MRNGFDAISGVLIHMGKSFNGGEPFSILILPSPTNNGDVRDLRRRPMHSEEAHRIIYLPMLRAAVEHRCQHQRVAASVARARQIEPLRSAQHGGPQLVPLRDLVVHHRHGPEHQLLHRQPRWELPRRHERLAAAAGDDAVAVALDDGVGRRAVEAHEERDVVVVDDAVDGVERHAAVDGEDLVVAFREG